MQTQTGAQMVAHSKNQQSDELASLMITFPRYILAELNTHRMLSKNSASSRAIPIARLFKSVKENPFSPSAWQKEHTGMQGFDYWDNETCGQAFGDTDRAFQYKELHNQLVTEHLTNKWLIDAEDAVANVESWQGLKTTKQLINCQLEPFMWHTVLITGNVNDEAWVNFWNLRCPVYEFKYQNPQEEIQTLTFKSRKDYLKKWRELTENITLLSTPEFPMPDKWTDLDWRKVNKGLADIHMMDLAEAIWDAINESEPRILQPGEWHIVFGEKLEIPKLMSLAHAQLTKHNREYAPTAQELQPIVTELSIKISTAMAARTSYTVVGDEKEISYEKLIDIHDKLIVQKPLHASPMEHNAQAMTDEEYAGYSKTKLTKKGEFITENGWCRNFKGFIQYREILEQLNK